MLINKNDKMTKHVEFVNYTGRYPNLCSGILTLKIDGKKYTFGNDYTQSTSNENHERFWHSTGSCGFLNNYENSYINSGDWAIDVEELPEEIKQYALEIDEVFNANVAQGCCGGCL